MATESNQPRKDDAVLGGEAPQPITSAVLGGIEGVKHRLASPLIEARIAAVNEALKYGDAGLDLVIKALQDADKQVQLSAYLLLRERTEPQVQQALKEYKTWDLSERLHPEWYYATKFANRKVENFNPETDIVDAASTAYALRCVPIEENSEILEDKFRKLCKPYQAKKIEALVFGLWTDYIGIRNDRDSSSIVVDMLVGAKQRLTNLKAVFIGDIPDNEGQISGILQSDISPVLQAYPKLEVLQIRGGNGLRFSSLEHKNLKVLIIETGGLNRETIAQICDLQLPALEHLELWLGCDGYGGDSSIEDLMPILSGDLFPRLSYLGLRNSEYTDEIAAALVNSPVLEQIIVLDLSMGTLTDEGALALLNCPVINQLNLLNVSENYLSDEMIQRLSELEVEVIADNQKPYYSPYGHYDPDYRYCSVAE
jgi:hypothetical protein